MMPPVSENTALFLDIDGTLLDLARTPDRVKVPRELVRALENLAHRLSGALAFVSGRSLDSIDRLFAPFRPAAIGAHGARNARRGRRRSPQPAAAGFGAAGFRGFGRQYSRLAAGRQEIGAGAALPAGAGSAVRS